MSLFQVTTSYVAIQQLGWKEIFSRWFKSLLCILLKMKRNGSRNSVWKKKNKTCSLEKKNIKLVLLKRRKISLVFLLFREAAEGIWKMVQSLASSALQWLWLYLSNRWPLTISVTSRRSCQWRGWMQWRNCPVPTLISSMDSMWLHKPRKTGNSTLYP